MNPIYVDLDGTFYKTDTLHERLCQFLIVNPFRVFRLLGEFLCHGTAPFKAYVHAHFNSDDDVFPERKELIEWLRKRKSQGAKIFLISASPESVVRGCYMRHLDLFDDFFCGDNDKNLKGLQKAEFIYKREGVDFTYIGNAKCDLHVWKRSSEPIAIGARARQLCLKSGGSVSEFPNSTSNKSQISETMRLIRARQWLKNTLVFVPFILSDSYTNKESWISAWVAFFLMSAIASAGYIVNDILDIQKDRRHPIKCFRPIAAGEVQVLNALSLAFLLAVSALLFAFLKFGFAATGLLMGYFTLTLLYSAKLKRLPIVDVFSLSSFYLIRLLFSALVLHVYISQWFALFFFFFFLSLACNKRYSELAILNEEEARLTSRRYGHADMSVLSSMGIGLGLISIVILVLYVAVFAPPGLYAHSSPLFVVAVAITFFLFHLWLEASRKNVKGDLVLFATKDPTSIIIAIAVGGLFLVSKGYLDAIVEM